MNTISAFGFARTTPLSTQMQLRRNIDNTQSALFKLQQQISTGQKYQLPGQSPHSARRTILIQRLLESRETHSNNLQSAQQFLDLTDSNLLQVGQLLTDLKGSLLEVPQSTTTEGQREAIKSQLESAVQQLIGIGNTRIAGRYLFAGAATDRAPFSFDRGFVELNGNLNDLNTISGFNQLIQTNANASAIFGGSEPTVQGTVDLNPSLTEQTRLSELNGGEGIPSGFISISDTQNESIIDLREAKTVGDVIELIEANAPEGRTLDVQLVDDHLEITIDSASPSVLLIGEVNGGRAAHALGIYTNIASASSTVTGFDLDPVLTNTTDLNRLQLVDEFGSPTTLDQSSGFTILQDNQSFDVDISNAETIEDILNAINGSGAAVVATIADDGKGIQVHSKIAGVNFSIGENGGLTATQLGIRTLIDETRLADLNFGEGVSVAAGTDFVIETNTGNNLSIDISNAITIQDVLDIINLHPDNQDPSTQITARLATNGNGIELFDPNAPGTSQLTVTRSELSFAAVNLGLIPVGSDSATVSTDPNVLVGSDVNLREPKSLFTTLQRLIDSLSGTYDEAEFKRAMAMFELDFERLDDITADVALRGQRVDALSQLNDEEQLQLQTLLSDEFDVDVVAAISSLTIQETTLQSSLQLMARSFQLNLFSYI